MADEFDEFFENLNLEELTKEGTEQEVDEKSEETEEIIETEETDNEETDNDVELDEAELLAKQLEEIVPEETDKEEEVKEEVKVDKQGEAFKRLREEKAAEEKARKELEEKLAKREQEDILLKKYIANNLEGYNGDLSKADAFVKESINEQYKTETGKTIEEAEAERLKALEVAKKDEEIEMLKGQLRQIDEEKALMSSATKLQSVLTTNNASGEELGEALKLYENATGIPIFSDLGMFNKAKPQVFSTALKLYRSKQSPKMVSKQQQVTAKPKEQQGKESNDKAIEEMIKKYLEDL